MSTLDPHLKLEHSYRRLLWLLPPGYRRARGPEVVDVLMERADPGQLRPSRGEMAALLRFSARTWGRHAISPSLTASRNAMGVLAVLLPMMLLFPAAAALHIAGLTGAFRMDSLPFGADIPAWLLWCVTAVLIVFAPASWPRYSAVLGAVAYLVATVVQYQDSNFLVVGNSIGLLAVQTAATLTLASPERLDRGRKLAPRWCLAALGAITATVGFLLSTIEYREPFINSPVLLPITAALAAALALVALFTATGRALLPIVAALAELILVAKYRAGGWGNNQSGMSQPWGHITARDVLVLIAAPVTIFVLVRVVTAFTDWISRQNPQGQSPAQS